MKNFYMAVYVKTVSEMTNSPEGYCAYRVKFSSGDNLKSVLDRIGGLKAANMCATKKEADELVKMWNETFKENGVYAY